jgi:hypothetical protein
MGCRPLSLLAKIAEKLGTAAFKVRPDLWIGLGLLRGQFAVGSFAAPPTTNTATFSLRLSIFSPH